MGQIDESMAEKGKVLIVDDKQIERVMLKKILSDTYEVVEAENGKKAFEILYERSEEITAVLLDIVMPEYDGYYFLERYHKAQMYQAIPVVVLTMEIDIETEVRCLSMGAWDSGPECDLVAVNICNYSNFHSKVSFLSFNRNSYM